MDFIQQNTTDGQVQKNLFEDLQNKIEFNRLERNNNTTNFLKRGVIDRVSSKTVETQTDNSPNINSTYAKLNQQFFVWKGGQAGRIAVDTPFGFENI